MNARTSHVDPLDDITVHAPNSLTDFLTVMPMIQFDVAGMPAPQGSKKIVGYAQNNHRVIEDNDPAKRMWRTAVSVEAKRMAKRLRELDPAFEPLDGPLFVVVDFVFPRPPSAKTRKYPHTKPDIDKLARALLDSLKGILIADDSRVVRLLLGKNFGEPGSSISIGQLEEKLPKPTKPGKSVYPIAQESIFAG